MTISFWPDSKDGSHIPKFLPRIDSLQIQGGDDPGHPFHRKTKMLCILSPGLLGKSDHSVTKMRNEEAISEDWVLRDPVYDRYE